VNHPKPPFDLPVLYEDDYFCIGESSRSCSRPLISWSYFLTLDVFCAVNKPGGVVVHAHRKGGHGTMTVRAALPFAVKPPKAGTHSTLRFPQPVHRLDKPTSGLLIAAKTKPAMVDLSGQFRDRKVKKTYIAICNGIPPELPENSISSQDAYELGVDVDPDSDDSWQLIDHPLDEKSAVTVWRALKYAKSLKADQNYLTMVELKPKTGRFHQLRRHMVRT
jgi:23S rRNA-/tRNA-specific pseudouridylate synthase